jgi:hypothetical protein
MLQPSVAGLDWRKSDLNTCLFFSIRTNIRTLTIDDVASSAGFGWGTFACVPCVSVLHGPHSRTDTLCLHVGRCVQSCDVRFIQLLSSSLI